MINLSISPSILIVSIVAIITVLLYLREYFSKKKILKQQELESQQLKQKTAQLLAAAEAARTQILGQENYIVKQLAEEFKSTLLNLLDNSEKSVTSSTEQLDKFLKDLQQRSLQFEETSRKTTEQRINRMFENLEQRLADFLVATEQKTTQSIELELKAARHLIEGYKSQQLKLIDENIIAMMEQTLNLVLAKKLSLKDQLDLVYEALEKAKIDKFVV